MRVSKETTEQINELVEIHGMSQGDVVTMLLDIFNSHSGEIERKNKKTGKIELKNEEFFLGGKAKVERGLKIWLHSKVDFKITATVLKQRFSVQINSCKEVIEVYADRVNKHNEKFE